MTNQEFIESIALEGEEWRDVVGFEGCYMASSLGRIISLKRMISYDYNGQKQRVANFRILKQSILKNGYKYVKIRDNSNGKKKLRAVHRLIASTFIANIDNKPYIDHINGNKADNRITNLRWCTPKENSNNPHALRKNVETHLGKKAWNEKTVLCFRGSEIIKIYQNSTIAEKDGFLQQSISKCCRGKMHSHKGLQWMYLSDYEFLINKSKNLSSIGE